MILNFSEAKANLSRLIDKVYHGKTVVVAKNNLPLADLVIHTPTGTRKLGVLKDKAVIPDDIMDDSNEINDLFYGDKS